MLNTYNINSYEPPANLLKGKTVLITGAAGALGSAIAMAAAGLGCELVLLDKNERGLNSLYDDIASATGIEAGLYPLDLTGASVDDYEALANTIENEFSALNGLIHCAVELGQLSPFANSDPAQWQKSLTANLHGPVFLSAAVLPLMRQSTPASVVFTIDYKRKAYWNSYAASKAALASIVSTLSDELDADRDASRNLKITCNAVQPAKMRSSFRRSAFPGENPASVPYATDNVWPYLFLLSPDARGVNGLLIDRQQSTGT